MTTLALLVLGVLAGVALASAARSTAARYRRLRSRVRRLTRTRVVLTTKAPARRGRAGAGRARRRRVGPAVPAQEGRLAMNPIVDQDAARMRALVIDRTGDQELADQVAEAVVNAHRLGQMSGLDYAARRLEALAAEAAVAAGDTGHRWHRWATQAYRIAGAALRMDWHAIKAEGGAR